MAKPFLSFQDQIYKLEHDKALSIPNKVYAESMLRLIGYFTLIVGYERPFINPTTKKYRDGVAFEDIVALYKFDENLREVFLKYILQVELHIRSLIAYYFTEKHGNQQAHYLNPANFTGNPKYEADVKWLIDILDRLANHNSDYSYICYYRKTYGNVPLWVLVGGLSFGMLSKLYSITSPDLRVKVSKNFDGVNEKQLEQYLSVITKFRNVCAHNERLFTYQTRCDIPNTALHRKLNISQKGIQYTCGKHDLFAVVIAFRYLLPDRDFKRFKGHLLRVLAHYRKQSTALSESELYRLMGFPPNWAQIMNFRKI